MDMLHPGVYLQEVSSGVQPIEGVSTSTSAFIGKAEMGTLDEAYLATSLSDFTANYGTYLSDGYLAYAAASFFNNGGTRAYIIRVAGSGAAPASITLRDRKGASTLLVSAKNEGVWGNTLDLVVTDGTSDPDNFFNLAVYRNQSDQNPPLPSLLLETLTNLSMDPNSASFVDSVSASATYITTTADAGNAATAVAGVSRSGMLAVGNGAPVLLLGVGNGGTETVGAVGPPATPGTSQSGPAPSTNPPADQRRLTINLNGDGPQDITLLGAAATGTDVAAAIQAAVRALSANSAVRQPAYDNFTASYQVPVLPAQPFYLLTSGTQGASSSVVAGNSTATPIHLPAGAWTFNINLNSDGPQQVTINGPQANGVAIAGAITTAVQALFSRRASNSTAYQGFKCTYDTTAGVSNPSLLLERRNWKRSDAPEPGTHQRWSRDQRFRGAPPRRLANTDRISHGNRSRRGQRGSRG